MLSKAIPIIIPAVLLSNAAAEPQVFINPNPTQRIQMGSYDPGLPNIRFAVTVVEHGATLSNTYYLLLREYPGDDCAWDFEPQFYNIEAPASVSDTPPYADPAGLFIDNATPDWTVVHIHTCIATGGQYGSPSFPVVHGDWGKVDQCVCRNGGPAGFPADETRYIPFRFQHLDTTDWYYGWVSFRVVIGNGICPNICKKQNETVDAPRVEYLGFGLESEPNTPIIVGGGLCPGDINFDAQRDTFDVFDYLDFFNTLDPAADYDNDGVIDVFDVFAFLDDFQTPCEF